MNVAAKLVGVLVLVLILIRTVEGYLAYRRESAMFEKDMHRDAMLLGRTLQTLVRDVWILKGRDRALQLVEAANLNQHPVHISWVWFDGADGLRNQLDADAFDRLSRGQEVFVKQEDVAGDDAQYYYVPINGADAPQGALVLAESLAPKSRYLRQTLIREGIAGSVVVLISGAAVVLLGVVVVGRPLSQLHQRMRRIGEGDLAARLAWNGRDEFAVLAHGLNEMCDRLGEARQRAEAETEKRIAAMEQVRHVDRLTTIGRLAAGIAHELGTPLNVVSGRAGMIATGSLPPAEVAGSAQTIKAQAERMTGIIRRLLDFARQCRPKPTRTNIVEVVDQAIDLVTCLGYKGTVRVVSDHGSVPVYADADASQLQQVMTNLIQNALQAMPNGGNVDVHVGSTDAQPPPGLGLPERRYVSVSVRDQGVGIAEENLSHVFDPFFTTKDVGEGTGLGLSIAYGIVREHGGWIDVASEVDRGTRFCVYLPEVNGDERTGADRR